MEIMNNEDEEKIIKESIKSLNLLFDTFLMSCYDDENIKKCMVLKYIYNIKNRYKIKELSDSDIEKLDCEEIHDFILFTVIDTVKRNLQNDKYKDLVNFRKYMGHILDKTITRI